MIQKTTPPMAMESLRLIFPDGTRVVALAPLAVAYSAGDAVAFMRKRVNWSVTAIASPSGVIHKAA